MNTIKKAPGIMGAIAWLAALTFDADGNNPFEIKSIAPTGGGNGGWIKPSSKGGSRSRGRKKRRPVKGMRPHGRHIRLNRFKFKFNLLD